MQMVVTLRERKQAKVAAMWASWEELRPTLISIGQQYGGRFLLFGSAARDQLRPDSDFDVLLDFPAKTERDAFFAAERAATDLGVAVDLVELNGLREAFRSRVLVEAKVIA